MLRLIFRTVNHTTVSHVAYRELERRQTIYEWTHCECDPNARHSRPAQHFSIALRQLSISFVAGRHSAPYIPTGRETILQIFDLRRFGIFLLQKTAVIECYFDHAALTREFTSNTRPPSKAIADASYLECVARTSEVPVSQCTQSRLRMSSSTQIFLTFSWAERR